MLDPIHNQGLRLALGAFRTSPFASLYVEADEPSLYSGREKLSLQYAIRLAASDPINTVYTGFELLLIHQILLMKLHSHQFILIYMNKNINLLNLLTSEFHHS